MKPASMSKPAVFFLWIGGLGALLLAVAVVANFSLGQSSIEKEAGEHWRPSAAPARETLGPASYNTVARVLDRIAVSVLAATPVPGATKQHGSGVFVAPGLVLTNEHVIRQATALSVTVHQPSQATYPASLVLRDTESDLALLRVDAALNHDVARLGNSDAVRPGDVIFAAGDMLGLGNTVTSGIVSDRRNNLVIDGRVYREMLQLDVTMNHGSSGGPLVNASAELVGINTAVYSPGGAYAGIGFATPINKARALIDRASNLARGTPQPGVELAALATPGGSPGARQALLVCQACGTARYLRCPVCEQRLVLDGSGRHMVCPAGHDVASHAHCPRCGSLMGLVPPGQEPFSLAV